jgi:hypothetical protein
VLGTSGTYSIARHGSGGSGTLTISTSQKNKKRSNQMTTQFTKANIISNNHAILYTEQGEYLQSYQSIIAFREYHTGKITLDAYYWNYSKTTGKHRNEFLGETKAETDKKIKSGEYATGNLNA